MKTKFNNVADAAAQLAADQGMVEEVGRAIADNSLVSVLLTMRVKKGLTQDQIAEAMGCDPSKVSRLESGSDCQLRWMDIIGYARALKLDMSVIFDDSGLPAAERIKHCVFRIDEDLEKLGTLAKELGAEDEITKEIDRFYRQVLFNFLTRFKKNSERLSDVIRISSPAEQPVQAAATNRKRQVAAPRALAGTAKRQG